MEFSKTFDYNCIYPSIHDAIVCIFNPLAKGKAVDQNISTISLEREEDEDVNTSDDLVYVRNEETNTFEKIVRF